MNTEKSIHPGINVKKKSRKFPADKNVRHSQQLETLGVLTGGLAHDFNNLLVTILGSADLALHRLPKDNCAYLLVEHIRDAALRAAGLTNQMLTYAGRGNGKIIPLDLNRMVEEMAMLLKVSISKNVLLRFIFAENIPAIEAEDIQIRQIIMNLITNASQAIGEESGTITISTGHAIDSNGMGIVTLSVADTGCGMDEKTSERMFDPFFTTRAAGRGLGMAIVRENVRCAGGMINVDSTVGKGATITVSFPASDKKAAYEKAMEMDEEPLPTGATLLVIDDDPEVLEVIRSILDDPDIDVHEARSGREGIDVFRRRKDAVDLVLIDLTMPAMDGDAALREIRNIRDDVAVILSSGYSEQDVRERLQDSVPDAFIQKPYKVGTLIGTINRLLKPNKKK